MTFQEWQQQDKHEQQDPYPQANQKLHEDIMALIEALKHVGWKWMYCDNTSTVWDVNQLLASQCNHLLDDCRVIYGTETIIKFRQYCLRENSLAGMQIGTSNHRRVHTTI